MDIAKDVPEDKFLKMQRFNIFIAKMEDLQKAEKNVMRREKKAFLQM